MMQGSSSAPHTRTSSGTAPGGPEDGDNRSRNAKAQRRHREKRKAHFKMLEESVQVLQAQLEEARRQLSTAAYANARLAYSPENKDAAALAQENAYLRDQNAELRRQVYAFRGNYEPRPPGSAPPLAPPPPGEAPKVTPWMGGEIKQEPASGAAPYGVYGVQQSSVVSPPRVSSSSHGRTMSHPGDFVRDPAAKPGSASTPTTSYPPSLYQFGTISGGETVADERHAQRTSSSSSRGRLLSSSSAPSASPYVTSAPFPTDPRAHELSTHTPTYPVRYESTVYPAVPPPPHSMPRSAAGASGGPSGGYPHGAPPGSAGVAYVTRADTDVAWGQDPAQQQQALATTPASASVAVLDPPPYPPTYTPDPSAIRIHNQPDHWPEEQRY